MATNGAEVVASELMTALLTGVDVTVPTINTADSEFQIPGDTTSDAYDVLLKLTNADLTTGAINGTGSFDKLMVGVAAQLQGEYDAGRITGAEYSKAYITLTQSALATSLQFLLGKDASYWQAVQAQTQAVIARVQLATVKAENARAQMEALTAKSNYALTKLKLATEDIQYGSLKYKLDNIDPLQVTQLTLQNSGITTSNLGLSINNDIASYNLTTTLPKQSLMLDAQTAQTTAQTDQIAYTTTSLMPAQLAQTTAQTSHIGKQELATVQQTSNLESQQAQVEIETNKLIYELTYRIPEEVRLIKLNQDQVIAQNNKVATDTIIAIKQGHLVDAQTCQVTSETNRIKAEVALKLPEEVKIAKLNQLQLTAQTDQTTYTTQHILPAQFAQITGQTDGITKTNVGIDTANSIASYNLTTVLPKQQEILIEQLATAVVDKNTKSYNLSYILPAQKLNLQEQAEAQRAQTLDTRSDGVTAVAGSIGKQNSLYSQQIVSYQKDSQLKAAKVVTDTWITCRSIAEDFPLPKQFDYLSPDYATEKVYQAIIDDNDLG